jgi:ectoine hydroxylase
VWVALENIRVGSGGLLYYPGSHKLHYVISEDFESGNTALQLDPTTRESYESKIEELMQQHACADRPFWLKKAMSLSGTPTCCTPARPFWHRS